LLPNSEWPCREGIIKGDCGVGNFNKNFTGLEHLCNMIRFDYLYVQILEIRVYSEDCKTPSVVVWYEVSTTTPPPPKKFRVAFGVSGGK
jgi:hypothetical protein